MENFYISLFKIMEKVLKMTKKEWIFLPYKTTSKVHGGGLGTFI